MADRLYAQMFGELIDQLKGVVPAAAAIEAATGRGCHVGTLSKINDGKLEVPFAYSRALENATGNYCFTRMRNREVDAAGVVASRALDHVRALRESHEMVVAQAEAEKSDNPDALARALRETLDVLRVAEEDAALLQQKLRMLGLEAAE